MKSDGEVMYRFREAAQYHSKDFYVIYNNEGEDPKEILREQHVFSFTLASYRLISNVICIS